jgi:hypothetical protein
MSGKSQSRPVLIANAVAVGSLLVFFVGLGFVGLSDWPVKAGETQITVPIGFGLMALAVVTLVCSLLARDLLVFLEKRRDSK